MTLEEFESWFKKANKKFLEKKGTALVITQEYNHFCIMAANNMDEDLENAHTLSDLVEAWEGRKE